MKLWRDYANKSVLTVIFGLVSAEVFKIDTMRYGVMTHPGRDWEHSGSLDEAKLSAEQDLRKTMTAALARLSGNTN